MAAKVIQFVSRATLLQRRGWRNYSRFKQLTNGLVAADGPERLGWQRESAEEEVRDAEWNRRHGRTNGPADILRFKRIAERAEWRERRATRPVKPVTAAEMSECKSDVGDSKGES